MTMQTPTNLVIRALADRAADVALVDEDWSLTKVEMGEMADGSHRWHALVTLQDGEHEQVYRIATPALGDTVPKWAQKFQQWTTELRIGDGWMLLLDDEA